jgi:non-structural maintenance of chromosomes element 4
LRDVIGRVGALHARAQRPKEYAVDAEVFAQLAACGLDMVRRGATQAAKRTPADFVAQLRTAHALRVAGRAASRAAANAANASNANAPQIDWAALGAAAVARGVFSPAAGAATMLGPLGEAPKQPSDKKKASAAAAAAKRAANKKARMTAEELDAAAGPKVKPREVTDDLGAANPDGDDKQETDRQMDAMWEALMERADPEEVDGDEQQQQRVLFVDVAALVVNHQSFAQTVENLFTLSFLVRDQRVRLEHDPALGLVVRPFSLEQQRAIKEGSAAEAAAAVGADDGGGGGGGAGGRSTRGCAGGRPSRQQQQQQQQAQAQQQQRQQQGRLAHQFVVRFTHADWEIMKALVPRAEAVTPHRTLGANLANEDANEAAAAREAAAAAREAARREQDARDEEKRAADRARRRSEREQLEQHLRTFATTKDGVDDEQEEHEQDGDENAPAGGGGGGGGAGLSGKKRAREAGGGDAADDLDVVDNRFGGGGKAMRVSS